MVNQLFSNKSVSIFNVIRNIVTITKSDVKAANIDQALSKALTVFRNTHPNWVNSLFNQHFVMVHVKPVVEMNLSHGRLPSALDLAMLWDRQFGEDEFSLREACITELTQAAKVFVNILNAELR